MHNPKTAELLKNNPTGKEKLDFFDLIKFIESNEQELSKDFQEILAKCVRHFAKKGASKTFPKKTKDNDAIWASLAVYKDSDRPWMNRVYAPTEDKIVSTDGHRLHLATEQENLSPETHYDVIKGKLVEALEHDTGNLSFPPYEQVIPTIYQEDKMTVSLSDFKETVDNVGDHLLVITNSKGKEIHMNKKYVVEAFGARETMDMYSQDSLDPVVFTSGNRLAVVMPTRHN